MVQFTIDPTTAGFSREVALYMANVCDLAYNDQPVHAARDLLGLDAEVFHHTASDTQGFIGRTNKFAVLAFRGSEQFNEHPKDWLVDFQFEQTRDAHFTGGVHSGFSNTLSSAWDTIDAILRRVLTAAEGVGADDPGVPLFITGHSLGGALATLASSRLASGEGPATAGGRPFRVNHRATYTFGAPRVGDPEFCRTYTPFTCRVVNDLDIVPQVPLQGNDVRGLIDHLPPFTPDWIRKLVQHAVLAPPYGHVETLFHLDATGAISKQAAGSSWLRDYFERSLHSLARSLNAPVRDHMIDSYIQALHR
jgi:hypothetical protein